MSCWSLLTRQPPVLTVRLCGYLLRIRSQAGNSTTVAFPADGIRACFDMGLAFRDAVNQPNVFITHGHMDHVGTIVMHAATRSLNKQAPPRYFVNPILIDPIHRVFDAFRELDGTTIPYELVPLVPGDTVWLPTSAKGVPKVFRAGEAPPSTLDSAAEAEEGSKKSAAESTPPSDAAGGGGGTTPATDVGVAGGGGVDGETAGGVEGDATPATPSRPFVPTAGMFVRPFRTIHRIESQGYLICRRTQRLAAEYKGVPVEELRALNRARVKTTEAFDSVEIVVSGDTAFAAIRETPEVHTARVLVLECTIVDGASLSPEETRLRGHVHLDEIAEAWASGLLRNEVIYLKHFSPRHSGTQVSRSVARTLRAALRRDGVELLGWDPVEPGLVALDEGATPPEGAAVVGDDLDALGEPERRGTPRDAEAGAGGGAATPSAPVGTPTTPVGEKPIFTRAVFRARTSDGVARPVLVAGVHLDAL